MPKLDLDAIELVARTTYPMPFAADMNGRFGRMLCSLSDFGVAQMVMKPGAKSSHRAWSEADDEFIVMLDGDGVLVEEECETTLRPGDCIVFPKGVADGHYLVNRSNRDCTFLAIFTTANGTRHYPDIDLVWDGPSQRYTHKDGTPY